MRPTGAARSNERSGSYQKRASPAASKLPANYKPPHLRGTQTNTNRVSPGAAPRTGVQRQSPNTRPGQYTYGANKASISPANRFGTRVSPNRAPISNLGGPVNLQRKAPGVKVAPGQTNFLERNRQKLEEIAQRNKERSAQRDNSRTNSIPRVNRVTNERSGSYNRNVGNSNDSRKARQPLYQPPRDPRNIYGTNKDSGGKSLYERSKERIAAREKEKTGGNRLSGTRATSNSKFVENEKANTGHYQPKLENQAAAVKKDSALKPVSLNQKINELKQNPSQDAIDDKLSKLQGLLAMAKNQR
jgi:hypothetical protein